MDFFSVPVLVIGIITFGIYKLFELFVHKKERLNIIEKLGDKLNSSNTNLNLSMLENSNKFNTLKIACLLLGVGLGLLIGYIICATSIPGFTTGNYNGSNVYEITSITYGASVLIFGGIGLLVSFLVEMNYLKRKSDEEKQ